MKYASTLFATFLMVLFVATAAQAAPEKDASPSPAQQADPTKEAEAVIFFENFQDETEPLRTQLHSKTLQLKALSGSAAANPDLIARLSDDIAGLHSELHKKWREFRTKCRNELGPDAHKYFGGEHMVFPDPALYYDGWPVYGAAVAAPRHCREHRNN